MHCQILEACSAAAAAAAAVCCLYSLKLPCVKMTFWNFLVVCTKRNKPCRVITVYFVVYIQLYTVLLTVFKCDDKVTQEKNMDQVPDAGCNQVNAGLTLIDEYYSTIIIHNCQGGKTPRKSVS
jgi:hypothetical protein